MLRVLLAQPDRQARQARRVQQALLVRLGLRGLPDLRVLPALRVLRALRARRDPPELLALRGQLVLPALLVLRGLPDLLVRRVPQEQRESLVPLDLLALRGSRDLLVRPVLLVLVSQVLPDRRVLLALLGPRVQPALGPKHTQPSLRSTINRLLRTLPHLTLVTALPCWTLTTELQMSRRFLCPRFRRRQMLLVV